MNLDSTRMIEDPFEAMSEISNLKHRTTDVDVGDGHTVTIRSLGAKDETDTFIECMNYWGQAFLYKHKLETLARAITAIDGQSLPEEIDIAKKKKLIEKKKEIIGKWHQEVIDDLYTEFAKLTSNLDAFLNKISLTSETNVTGIQEAEKQKNVLNNRQVTTDELNEQEKQNESQVNENE